MPSVNDKLEQIFFAALEIDSVDDRNDFLDQACGELLLMRTQVDRLLSSHGKATDFLEQCPSLSFEEFVGIGDVAATQAHYRSQDKFQTDEQLPRYFGDYELLEKIAQGGMGVVFKAQQASLNRIVAIKMISSGQFAGEVEIKRFYVEAEAAGKLDHPGIVPVFDVGCFQGRHYYSMAFVEGQSLSARIRKAPLSPRQAASMVQQIATAIQVAHDQGIIHRDLKPGNVLLDDRDQPRITDFGLAKRVEGESELTTTGIVLGTLSYMPPEQAAGKKIEAAADIYSLGAILYAMLTGRPPFESNSQLNTILQVLHDEPVAPRKIDKRIPRDLEAICLKCLEKNVSNRYKTASDLSADLQRYLAGEPIQAKDDWWRRVRRWMIREPVLAAHLTATVVILAILIVGYWIWHKNGPGQEYNFRLLEGNVQILLGWAIVVLVLQKVQNVFRTKTTIPSIWAAINPIFLTITLLWNGSSGEGAHLVWLLSLYSLFIVTNCFFRRVDLVAITTIFSLFGFGVLVVSYFEKSVFESPSYLVVFAVNMAGTGALSCLLTHRLKLLGEQHNL